MKLNAIFVGLLCVLLVGCVSHLLAAVKPEVDVVIVNKSSRDLENAEAHFGDHTCRWGWVIKTATNGYGFYPHPITAQAELHWDESGGHRVENLDLSKIYLAGKSGRLTFTVYDGRVEVTFREKST